MDRERYRDSAHKGLCKILEGGMYTDLDSRVEKKYLKGPPGRNSSPWASMQDSVCVGIEYCRGLPFLHCDSQ